MIRANHKIIYDPTNCIGCKLCFKACFVDVIRWDEEKKQPIFKYMGECEHCRYCQAVCPKECIEVIIDLEGQSFRQSFDMYRIKRGEDK